MGGAAPAWVNWATGVLAGVSAPASTVNLESLWNWSNKESGFDVMRWNNPLNTTEELRAGADIDPDMNRVGVESYPSVIDGIAATVATLLNGRYPTIVTNLRLGVPHQDWQNAAAELDVWGTHADWLTWDLPHPAFPNEGGPDLLTLSEKYDAVIKAFAAVGLDAVDYAAFLNIPAGRTPEVMKTLDSWASAIADDGHNVADVTAQIILNSRNSKNTGTAPNPWPASPPLPHQHAVSGTAK